MANPLRDMSLIMQVLLALAITVVLVVVGVYVPGSPVAAESVKKKKAVRERAQLNQEVTQLQVYRQRYSELKSQMDALNKQLDTLKTIVPEEKEVDEFIRLVQGAASSSNVQLRRLTAQAIVSKEYHYEMPFELQADGPYFNILDIFAEPTVTRGAKYPLRPGTTVSGVFTATTFFTKSSDAGAAGPAKPAGKP